MAEEELTQTNESTPEESSNLPSEENLDTSGTNTQDEVKTDVTDENEEESDDSDTISDEELEHMSDEDFVKFIESGKRPEIKIPKEKTVADKSSDTPKSTENTVETKNEIVHEVNPTVDYKSAYETIFKPFKANGREITPKTVEDVISLMQMGANYGKKMQLLAPMRKAVESLNKAGINEDDLNFLIDIHKGDKEAIKQLLQNNKIDLAELDLDDIKYTKNHNNIASKDDVDFADVLTDAHSSLPKIREILDNQWDDKSREMLYNDPRLLRGLHEEIEMGRFDEVQKIVENEKVFGRYKGVPDVQIYIDVVNKLLKQQAAKAQQQTITTPTKQQSVTQIEQPKQNSPSKSKAAPTRTKISSKGSNLTANDIFSMPEEEFNKLQERDLL